MKAWMVAGLAFGDEGKGRLTDYLVRRHSADLVVRYNGGCQAAHNVIAGGIHHTFSQFGSGTLAGGRTFLSRYMLIEPFALMEEAEVLKSEGIPSPMRRLLVDWQCYIITPWHRMANQIREIARGSNRHGSVGCGVGEARGDQLAGFGLRVRTLFKGEATQILRLIKEHKLHEMRAVAKSAPSGSSFVACAELFHQMELIQPAALRGDYYQIFDSIEKTAWFNVAIAHQRAVFEGAQGVLLDQTHGFAPHNTWTDCTFGNADKLLDEVGCQERDRIGVLRSYYTRHGAGPFPTEDPEIAAPEPHNGEHPWMGKFRVGHFDMELARYACECAKPDVIALTHMDQRPSPFVASPDFQVVQPSRVPKYLVVDDLPAAISQFTRPVGYCSYGPAAESRMEEMSVAVHA